MPHINLAHFNALRVLRINICLAHGLPINLHFLKLLDPEHLVFSKLVSEAVLQYLAIVERKKALYVPLRRIATVFALERGADD